jgi:hypothetical protein
MGANAQTSVPAFTAGQVLTAAQVTQINTGIPVFASSTERDAAFGGTGEKTLAEGQMAYLEDTNATQYYDGSSWAAVAGGKILQVLSTVKTDTFSSTSTSWTSITGLSVIITPSSATSKVLLMAQLSVAAEGSALDGAAFRITGGNAGNYVGDAAGSRIRSVFAEATSFSSAMQSNTILYLDSPATTSATTYQVEGITLQDGYYVNRSDVDTDSTVYARGASSIVAMEVSA